MNELSGLARLYVANLSTDMQALRSVANHHSQRLQELEIRLDAHIKVIDDLVVEILQAVDKLKKENRKMAKGAIKFDRYGVAKELTPKSQKPRPSNSTKTTGAAGRKRDKD